LSQVSFESRITHKKERLSQQPKDGHTKQMNKILMALSLSVVLPLSSFARDHREISAREPANQVAKSCCTETENCCKKDCCASKEKSCGKDGSTCCEGGNCCGSNSCDSNKKS